MNKNNLQQAIREFLSKDKSSLVTEETLTRAQLDKREDYLKDLKKQKKSLIKRYGKDAEAVMYGRATNLAKKAVSEMDKQKLKELVKTSLMNDEVEENKVYGPGELDFSGVITPEQKLIANAFMIDPTRTKFDYKNNAVTFPDPIRVELLKGGEVMLGSVKMGNRLGFIKGYFDENGNEIEGGNIKIPAKHPMGEGKKEDVTGPEGKPDGKIDSKDYLAKRDAAIQKAKGEVKEDIDLGHEEKSGTPSEGMHNTLLSYIKQDARGTYPKDYNKYFTFLRAQAKPMSGPNKPQIWVKFLKDLVKNNAVSMDDLVVFSEKGYNDGKKGIEGLAGYLYKQGTPEILRKIDNLSNQSNMNEDMDLGHEDNEPHMLKADLYRIGKYAMELYQMVDQFEGQGEVDFPSWWQAMITDSKEKMVKAKHYLDFEIKEPAIDAAVGVSTDEEPMMEAEISAEEKLAGKIAKALKDATNKDSSDQHNLKQARTALNKGNIEAAKKIANPYLSEKIAQQLKSK